MLSKKQLLVAAKEMVETMDLKDEGEPIKVTSDFSIEKLTSLVKEAISCIDPAIDEFTEETQLVIDELSEPVEKEEKEEPEEDTPEVPETSVREQVEDAQRLADLKDIAKANDEFKMIRGKLASFRTADVLKAAMLEMLNNIKSPQEVANRIHQKNIADAPIRKPVIEKEEGIEESKEEPVPEPEPEEEKKKERKPRAAGKSTLVSKIDFFTPLIKSGKYTQKELVDRGVEEFPHLVRSTLQTMLTDSKNIKYNKFPKLVVVNAEGKLTFEN